MFGSRIISELNFWTETFEEIWWGRLWMYSAWFLQLSTVRVWYLILL